MPKPALVPASLLLDLEVPLLVILALAALAANAATPASPADALLAWKSSLGNPAALSTWTNATQVSICTTWRGVACDAAGRVVSLRLRGLGLTGGLDALEPGRVPEPDLPRPSRTTTWPAPSRRRSRSCALWPRSTWAATGSTAPSRRSSADLSGLVELRLYNNNPRRRDPAPAE
ncbi:hypothetical protein Zm00014a_042254 [Zea mays]|uniref:Leucine-rich repeat-containing N-terminal plant-type domain-containing protein n=1 Tax=Zea mays TaxID=4577 RepID=A0A3L6D6T5_MAIZE|nr:hypothetical protein Zm00014a_042254 [Zea mays]